MKAGFYQSNPVFGKKEQNITTVSDALKGVDADLMVLPEFFATGYQFISMDEVAHLAEGVPGGETTETLVTLSKKHDMYIVAGLPEKDVDNYYNSAVITGPEGFIGIYLKTHLFFEEKLWFTPGNTGFKVFHTDVGLIGIMICFDWYFPESMRALSKVHRSLLIRQTWSFPTALLQYRSDASKTRCMPSQQTGPALSREKRDLPSRSLE